VDAATDVDAADAEGATEGATADAGESLVRSDLVALASTSSDSAFFGLNTQIWILIPTDQFSSVRNFARSAVKIHTLKHL